MSTSYDGQNCPYCRFPLKADSEVVACRACKVPHHKECWADNGGCTTFDCRETTYQSAAGDRLEIFSDERSDCQSAPARVGGVAIKLLAAALVISLLVLVSVVLAYINLLSDGEEPPYAYDPAVIATLDADYYIDYENGTIPISDLPIGARVVDPSWEWEYRLGVNYYDVDFDGDPTPPGEVKPVTWIVIAKNHYDGLEPHVTLLTEDLIALHTFDNSMSRGHKDDEYGYNHWGESGTANATHGLRPWLNSTGIHEGKGFYRAFSDSFREAVLTTTVPNKEWENGTAYSTQDYIFIPSTTEVGAEEHDHTYSIGKVYVFFSAAGDKERIAMIVGDGWYEIVEKGWGKEFMEDEGINGNNWFYWSRSPGAKYGCAVRVISHTGEFYDSDAATDFHFVGVRPALNLKSEILVSEINN